MPKDHGQQALLDYLATNDGEINQSEALTFFKHEHISTTYAAINRLVQQGKIKRRIVKGDSYYSIGSTTHITIPKFTYEHSSTTERRLQIILGIYIKYLSQHRTLPARIRYVDMVSQIISEWEDAALLIQCISSLVKADLSVADTEQLEKQFAALFPGYDPNRDVYDSLDAAIEALDGLDVFDTFNKAQIESIKHFDDRRNVYELEQE